MTPEVMDYNGAADFLGMSVNSLRQRVRRRQIPFVRIGPAVRFLRSSTVAWLEGQITNRRGI